MGDLLKEGSPLRELLDTVGRLIMLTMVWLICCLPVVTIGASCTAFYYSTVKAVRHEVGYPIQEFFRSFKQNLGRGLVMEVLLALWVIFLMMNWNVVKQLDDSHSYWMMIGQIPLYLLTMCYLMFAFPVMSRFSIGGWRLFKMTLVMTLKHLPWAILSLIGWCGIAAITWYFWAMLILVLPGVWCYASVFWMEPILRRYMPPPTEEDADAWYYEDLKEKKNGEEEEI